MITAVLDTNVLLSGLLSRTSIPGQVIAAWQEGLFQLVVSSAILTELTRALQEPYFRQRLTEEDITRIRTLLAEQAAIVDLTVQVLGVATHAEDDLILPAVGPG